MSLYDSILITGGGGMLAHALRRTLETRGLPAAALRREECDIADPRSVRRAFELHRPTLVLNCAAYTKVDLCEEKHDLANAVNGAALETLATAAQASGAKLVHYSTDFVFDGRSNRPYRPDDPTNPLSAYGRSKRLGEQLLQDINPPGWLIIRTAWLYGPGGPCFPQTMLSLARKGVPLRVVSDQVGCPTFTFDLAEATIDLLDHNAAGVWHVTNSGQTNWFGFTRAILEEFGVAPAELLPTTSAEWKQARPSSATRPAYSVLDITPLQQLLARPMRHWRDALRAYKQATDNQEAGTNSPDDATETTVK